MGSTILKTTFQELKKYFTTIQCQYNAQYTVEEITNTTSS